MNLKICKKRQKKLDLESLKVQRIPYPKKGQKVRSRNWFSSRVISSLHVYFEVDLFLEMNWGVVLGFYRFQQCRIESLDSTTVQGRLVLETKVHPIHA